MIGSINKGKGNAVTGSNRSLLRLVYKTSALSSGLYTEAKKGSQVFGYYICTRNSNKIGAAYIL
jgi:hypothetical protein